MVSYIVFIIGAKVDSFVYLFNDLLVYAVEKTQLLKKTTTQEVKVRFQFFF